MQAVTVTPSDTVLAWNQYALDFIKLAKIPPPRVARNLAIVHLSVYDAINGVVTRNGKNPFGTYLVNITSQTPRSGEYLNAVIASAAYQSLKKVNWNAGTNGPVVANQLSLLDSLYAAQISALNTSSVQRSKTRSKALQSAISWGNWVAETIVTLRSTDGSSIAQSPISYPVNLPFTVWRSVPPTVAGAPPVLPGWGLVVPFVIDAVMPFVPPGVASLDHTTPEYATEVLQTYSLGNASVFKNGEWVARDGTQEPDLIADFWAGGGGTVTPPGLWNVLARVAIVKALGKPTSSWLDDNALQLVSKNLDEKLNNKEAVSKAPMTAALATAKTLALLNSALADAAIVCWKTKFLYNFWRPLSAITELSNPEYTSAIQAPLASVSGQGWTPYLSTPNFPEFTSGHSTFSGAGAAILTSTFPFLYSASEPLTATVDTFIGNTAQAAVRTRSWMSFTQAAEEAGMSRLYGGIHFMSANTLGLSTGSQIASTVISKFSSPTKKDKKFSKVAEDSTVPETVLEDLDEKKTESESPSWKEKEQVASVEWN